jgi:hypothetical protein
MMKRLRFFGLIGLVAALLAAGLMVMTPAASAQSGGGYELISSTIDAGGGTSTGGGYSLSGTAGQPDAGTQSGGSYTVDGGFWGGLVETLRRLSLPFVTR